MSDSAAQPPTDTAMRSGSDRDAEGFDGCDLAREPVERHARELRSQNRLAGAGRVHAAEFACIRECVQTVE